MLPSVDFKQVNATQSIMLALLITTEEDILLYIPWKNHISIMASPVATSY